MLNKMGMEGRQKRVGFQFVFLFTELAQKLPRNKTGLGERNA